MPVQHIEQFETLHAIPVYSKLHSDQEREGKRAAARQYMEYGEEPHSAADKHVLKATWNYHNKFYPRMV